MNKTMMIDEAAQKVAPLHAPRRFLRLSQVLDRIPVSKSTFWSGCRSGRFPAPKHIGRIAVWDEGAIDRVLIGIEAGRI